MNQKSNPERTGRRGLPAFLARVRATLGHDLRTPLGTIVNYASVLEDEPSLGASELRDVPRRIREQAMQSAEMLELLLEATLLAAAPPRIESVEPQTFLLALLAEMEGDAEARDAAAPHRGAATVDLDPAILAFAWRAFLRAQSSRLTASPSVPHASVERRGGRVRLALTSGEPRPSATAPQVDVETFAREDAVELPGPRRLALRLVRDLVAARGGELELVADDAGRAAIYLNFPRSA